MLNSKKTVALAGILGGLALSVSGVTHAYGESYGPECKRASDGSITCSEQTEKRYTTKEGSTVEVHQSKSCTSNDRNRRVGPLSHGDGKILQGSSRSCSNSAP